MKTNKYLYNTDDVPQVPEEIIMRRVELITDLIEELLEVHYLERDTVRINDLVRAKQFWLELNNK